MNKEKINILLVEDDEDDYVITRDLLLDISKDNYEFVWISDPSRAVSEMCSNAHDIYIVDYQLGKYDGIEIITSARKKGCNGPFIMLTGQTDHEIDVKAMKAGVSDFLTKGEITPQLLERTIRYAINSKKSETELRKAEEKYRSFFETTIEGIFQSTPDGRLITANPGLARISGYSSPQELIKSFNGGERRLYVKSTRRAEFTRNLKKKDTLVNFESQIYRRDGSIIWVSENARAVRDDKGKILYFEGTVRDITIRKLAEEERGKLFREQIARTEAEKNAERTAKLLKITSALSEAVTPSSVADVLIGKGVNLIEADAGSMVIVTPQNTLKIIEATGYSEKTLKPWNEFPLNADTPLADAILKRKAIFLESRKEAAKNYKKFAEQYVQEIDGAWACLPLIAKKRVLGAIGLSYKHPKTFDKAARTFLLTLAQQGVQALERSRLYDAEILARNQSETAQKRLSFLNEASKTLSSSLDYKTTLANVAQSIVPRLADWCGIDLVDENNKIHNIAIAHSDKKKVELAKLLRKKYPPEETSSIIYETMRTGRSFVMEDIPDEMIEKLAKDKKHLQMLRSVGFKSFMIVPLTIHKKTIGAITFVTSPPSKVSFTKDDLLFAEELARRAAVAIENARLFEKSQEGIRVRDEFLNIASHELKTPLTSLQLQMQFLLHLVDKYEGMVPVARLEKMLENSNQQIKRLTNLINNLLDVSRISGRKLELEREEVDLNNLIKDIIGRFENASKAAGSEIRMKNGTQVVGKWDKFRIDQVATNLISNAIKYGEGKPITVSVEKDKDLAKIQVADRGIGINLNDKKRIFNRFVRTDSAKKYGGLGLGLHIARQIVEAHGGSIKVESKANQGSIFTVQLPL